MKEEKESEMEEERDVRLDEEDREKWSAVLCMQECYILAEER